METVVVKLPAHLKEWFISYMCNSGEQHLMEAWHDEGIEGDGVDFRYPYYSRKRGKEVDETADIVVTEYK